MVGNTGSAIAVSPESPSVRGVLVCACVCARILVSVRACALPAPRLAGVLLLFDRRAVDLEPPGFGEGGAPEPQEGPESGPRGAASGAVPRPGQARGPAGLPGSRGGQGSGLRAATRWRCLPRRPGWAASLRPGPGPGVRSRGPQEGRWPRGGPTGPAQPSLSPRRPLDALRAWAVPPRPAAQETGSSSWSVLSVALLRKTSRVLRLLSQEAGAGVSRSLSPRHLLRCPSRPPCSLPLGRAASSSPPPGTSRFAPSAAKLSSCFVTSHRRPLPVLLGLGDLSEPPSSRKPCSLRALGPAGVTLGSTLGLHASSPRGRASLSTWGRAPTKAAVTDPSAFGLTEMLDSSRKPSSRGPPSRRTGFPQTSGRSRPARPPHSLT